MTGKRYDKTFTFQSLQHFQRIVPEFKVLPVYEQSSNFSNDLWISIFRVYCASTNFQILGNEPTRPHRRNARLLRNNHCHYNNCNLNIHK